MQMVEDNELKRQKIQEVINTNKGEWTFDIEQGINFSNMLGKDVEDDVEREEIEDGIKQVDENLTLSNYSKEVVGRTSHITFTATDDSTDEEITISTEYE